ncbi:MAG: hypothetical protein IT428_08600 [Planctomycetaceae bacterium]|nr:hypothetical protein [Planctomycetaceae bacterium]
MSHAPRRNALPITIFPFLDVLVCTMGSLILILILLSARMRSHAATPDPSEAVASTEAASPELAPALPDAVPSVEAVPSIEEEPAPLMTPEPEEPSSSEEPAPELAEAAPSPPAGPTPRDLDRELRERIAELTGRLDVERAALRRQQEKVIAARRRTIEAQAALQDVEKRLAAMEEGAEKGAAETQKLDEERERLTKELEDLNRQIRMAQKKTNDVASKFAFVPYDGSSGTTRRPILIECTATGLRFIPEDVVITPSDIAGFSEKSNPLLAGSNALCRYWSTVDGLKSAEGEQPEPYVLLIIRPSGHIAYYYAQKMLSKLHQSHGYELLDDDDQLALPAADPKARELCRQAVAEAIAQRDRSTLAQEGDGGEYPESRRLSQGARLGGVGGPGSDLEPGMDEGEAGGLGTPRVARGGSASDSGGARGEGRAMRFRPGVGFEEVEPESKPAYDDPFDRANSAWEARNGATGRNAPGRSMAGKPRGENAGGAGTGGEDWTPKPITGNAGRAVKPGGNGAAGGGGSSFGPGNAESGTSASGTGSAVGDESSPFEQRLRDRGQGAGGSGKADALKSDSSVGTGGVASDGTATATSDGKTGGSTTASPNGPALPAAGKPGNSNAAKSGSKSATEPGGTGGTSPTAVGSSSGDSGMVTKSTGRSGGPSDGDEGGSGGSSSKGSNDEVSAGPGANFGPLSRKRGARAEGERRWGYYSRRASIGFQRDIPVQVLEDRLVLGQGREIPLEEGTSVKDTVERITDAVEEEARSWGRPPDSFYYVPTLKFVAAPGSEKSIEPLRVPLKREGLTSSVQAAQPPKTTAVPSDAFFPKRPAADAGTGPVLPAATTDVNRPSKPTETQNGAPSTR